MVLSARITCLCFVLAILAAGEAVGQGQQDEAADAAPAPAEPQNERTVRRLGDSEGEEYQLELAIPEARSAAAGGGEEFALPDAEQNERLQQLIGRLAANPRNRAALDQLENLLGEVLTEAELLMDEKDLGEAVRRLAVVRNVNPRKHGLRDAEQRLAQLQQVEDWLERAGVALQNERLVEPAGQSARHYYSEVLGVDPDNQAARLGLRTVQQGLVSRALEDARALDFESADYWLEQAAGVREAQELVNDSRAEIARFRDRKAMEIQQEVVRSIQSGEFDYAEFHLIDLIALGGHEVRVAELRERIERERVYGQYVPGQIIRDQLSRTGGLAPAVVIIPPGSFLMGSGQDERDADDNEMPQHRVMIERSFGLGRTEVTVAEFRVFVEASGYQTEAEAHGSSRVWDEALGRLGDREGVNWRHDYEGNPAADDLPVLHVSWNDAQAYARWLAEETGAPYRLPSEAEWEHAMRAGATTAYWWGDGRPREPVENLTGSQDLSATGRSFGAFFRNYEDGHWGPAPVASFLANSNELFDMAGNVSEWVQDCWHANYVRAPVDGSAWENPGCGRRVVRGGYWASAPSHARSASRLSADENLRGPQVGFRIARGL